MAWRIRLRISEELILTKPEHYSSEEAAQAAGFEILRMELGALRRKVEVYLCGPKDVLYRYGFISPTCTFKSCRVVHQECADSFVVKCADGALHSAITEAPLTKGAEALLVVDDKDQTLIPRPRRTEHTRALP